MANRYFHTDLCALEKGFCFIDGEATIESDGSVSAYSGRGISSVVQDTGVNVGSYKVTLSDKYNKLISAEVNKEVAAVYDPTALGAIVEVSTSSNVTADTPVVVFQAQLASAATAAKLPEGKLKFTLLLKNSGV